MSIETDKPQPLADRLYRELTKEKSILSSRVASCATRVSGVDTHVSDQMDDGSFRTLLQIHC